MHGSRQRPGRGRAAVMESDANFSRERDILAVLVPEKNPPACSCCFVGSNRSLGGSDPIPTLVLAGRA